MRSPFWPGWPARCRPRNNISRGRSRPAPHAIIPPAPADPTAKADPPPPASPAFTKPAKPPPSGTRCRYIKWADLSRLTFGLNVDQCPACGGRMKLRALVQDPESIERFLRHQNLWSPPKGLSPAPAPPYHRQVTRLAPTQGARALHRHLTAPQNPAATGRSLPCRRQRQAGLHAFRPESAPPALASPVPPPDHGCRSRPKNRHSLNARRFKTATHTYRIS